MGKLQPLQVERFVAPGKYADGDGLYFVVAGASAHLVIPLLVQGQRALVQGVPISHLRVAFFGPYPNPRNAEQWMLIRSIPRVCLA